MLGFRNRKSVPMNGIIHHTIPELTFFSEASRAGPQGVILHQPEQLAPPRFSLHVLPVIKRLIQFLGAPKE